MRNSNIITYQVAKAFLLVLGLFLFGNQADASTLSASYNTSTGNVDITLSGVYTTTCWFAYRSADIEVYIDGIHWYTKKGESWNSASPSYSWQHPTGRPDHTYTIVTKEYRLNACDGTRLNLDPIIHTKYCTVPAAMSNFNASFNSSEDKINLSWNKGGIRVTDYDLYVYLKDKNGSYHRISHALNPDNNSSSYEIKDILQAGHTYFFQLIQSFGGLTKILTKTLTVPLASNWKFTNLRLESNTSTNKVTIRWDDPSAKTAIKEAVDDWYYKIERRERYLVTSSWFSWTTLNSNLGSGNQNSSPQFYETNVDDCKEYEFKVTLYLKKDGVAGSDFVGDVNSLSETIKYPSDLGSNQPPALAGFTASVPNVCKKEVKIEWTELPSSQRHPCKDYWYEIIRYQKDSQGNRINSSGKVIASRDNLYGANGKQKISQNGTTLTFTDIGSQDYNGNPAPFVSGVQYRYEIGVRSRNYSNSNSPGTSYSSFNNPHRDIEITGPIETAYTNSVTASILQCDNGKPCIQINWQDPYPNESGFVVKREILGGGKEKRFTVAANHTSFLDEDPGICKDYRYTVYAKNDCDQEGKAIGFVQSTSAGEPLVIQKDISDTYTAGALKAYKGYAKDVVRLEWQVAKNKESLKRQKIYRAPLNNPAAKVLLPAAATLDKEQTSFEDDTADPNVLYRYYLVGEAECGINTILTNETSDIGYCIPWGTISGHVDYEGDVAVADCFMSATNTAAQALNKSLHFDGSGSRIFLNNPIDERTNRRALGSLFGNNPRTLEAWVKLDAFNGSAIFSYGNQVTGQLLSLEVPSDATSKTWNINLHGEEVSFDLDVAPDEWHHYALTYASGLLRLYVDGQLQENNNARREWSKSLNTGGSTQAAYGIDIAGKAYQQHTIQGYMDEIRFWSNARTAEEIKDSYRSFLVGNEDNLEVYLRLDEGIGTKAYDHSYWGSNNFNRRHADLQSGLESRWSNFIPPADKLGYNAMTDEAGNYTIQFARYIESATGSPYRLMPFIFNHQFQPERRDLILKKGATDKDGQDFRDISSFTVTGIVQYGKDENGDGKVEGDELKCPAEGVTVKVDGQIQFAQETGEPIQSDANGSFSIQVPIGRHFISLEKAGHTFATGRWPQSGAHDFQQPESGLEFVDSTQITVIGKVVGGLREGNKPTGFGLSKNNIGKASIVFTSTQGCYSDTITTDDITGEYQVALFPLEYKVEGGVDSNPVINYPPQTIDLVQPRPQQTERGSNAAGQEVEISYHLKHDFPVYRSAHTLSVLNTETKTEFKQGETEVVFKDRNGEEDIIPADQFGHPVFQKGEAYEALITVTEVYVNKDGGPGNYIQDTVPVSDAQLIIRNNLAENPNVNIQMEDPNGEVLYTFFGGEPSFTNNGDENDYLQTFEVTSLANGKTDFWVAKGYVLGSKPEGNSFATQGPDVVEHILRDPPGSNSYAELIEGVKLSSSKSMELMNNTGSSLNLAIHAGADFALGVGMQVRTEIEGSISNETNATESKGGGESYEETINIEQAISTGSSPDYVGADADLFIGRSQNMDFGVAKYLQVLLADDCGGDVPCKANLTLTSNKGNQYTIGRRKGFFVKPGGYGTYFVFSQKHIRDRLIPDLKRLRNQMLDLSPHYTKVFTDKEDPRFGANNDDPVWGVEASTETPLVAEKTDWEGPSYHFAKEFADDEVQVDSVRWFNQQIRLWEEALRLNEEQKVNATDGFAGVASNAVRQSGVLKNQQVSKMNGQLNNVSMNRDGNISFDAGHPVSSSAALSNNVAWQFAWEVNLDNVTATGIGVKINGIGVENNNSFTVGMTQSKSEETAAEQSITYGFTLEDENDGDFLTVDIFDGGNQNGPIFKTRGGQSSCPYEGEVKTKYYEPGTVIQPASVIRDQPGIAISPARLVNVLSDEQAVFTLTLKNDNTKEDRAYKLEVDETSNPFGTIIKIDGLDPNREFTVPAGGSIIKTITVDRGPEAYNYENLRLILSSPCDENIQVSETFSVKFLPTCSSVNLRSPLNQWVVNKSFNDTLEIFFNEYDINFASLEKIIFQYKPSNTASWTSQKVFFNKENAGKDTALISRNEPYTAYAWNIKNLLDGEYDLRVVSVCANGVERASEIRSGIIDRKSPHTFGSPTPADGVLSANDEISLRFNETINETLINRGKDLDIRGVLNGAEIRHFTSAYFSGTDRMDIPAMNLQNRSFSMEFWMKRDGTGETTILQYGREMAIGIDAENKLCAQIGSQRLTSTASVDNQKWHHVALTYERGGQIKWYIDAASDLSASATATIQDGGQSIVVGSGFQGNLHELRVWNTARTLDEVKGNYLKTINAKQSNLLGYWPMDEGKGTHAKDKKGRRPAAMQATWSFAQQTHALAFDGVDDYFKVNTSSMIFDKETDFTISFWFKGNNGSNITLLSNGPVEEDDELLPGAWAIQTDENGRMYVKNDGAPALPVGSINYFNGQWRHLALVVNRFGATKVYVDAQLVTSVSSDIFGPWASADLYLGAYGRFINSVETIDQHFAGSIDELRIWKTSRKEVQIDRDRYFNLRGDEYGLRAYFPFEAYQNTGGVELLYASTEDQTDSLDIAYDELKATIVGAELSTETPPVKMYRRVEKVNFHYAINDDHLILTPEDEQAARIENVTLDISVKNLQDMHGNPMESSVSWIAFVDQNQLEWAQDAYAVRLQRGELHTFEVEARNEGGAAQSFVVDNLPEWLEATPERGAISPQSQTTIFFRVKEGLNIGMYQEDIALRGDMGFDELLNIQLEVYAEEPDWVVDPAAYDHSMSIVGALEISGAYSTDTGDRLAAFIDGELRGVASLQHFASIDAHRVFMNIYGHSAEAKPITFQIWDASEGAILDEVLPEMTFGDGSVQGTQRDPIVFVAQELQVSSIALQEGWNWISVNLLPKDPAVNSVLTDLIATEGDIFRNQDVQDVYVNALGWEGDLSDNGGVDITEGFRLKVSNAQTLELKGKTIDLASTEIAIEEGENWIPYLGTRLIPINEALATYGATVGDLLRSQTGFATYDPVDGWIGSLTFLNPGESYVLRASQPGLIVFPESSIFARADANRSYLDLMEDWAVPVGQYASNMSIMARVSGQENMRNYLLVSYTDREEVRGVGQWIKDAFFLTAHGDDNKDRLHFELVDKNTGERQPLTETQNFTTDGFAIVTFQLTEAADDESLPTLETEINVYPNPIEGPFTIDYIALEAGQLTIKMLDVAGKTVALVYDGEVTQGLNRLKYNAPANLMNGLYLLVFEQGAHRQVVRIAKQ